MIFIASFRPLALAGYVLPAIEYKATMSSMMHPEVAA